MKWPPQSPDLNPIEQLWDYMDTKLEKEKRTSADQMWDSLQSVWNEIKPETLIVIVNDHDHYNPAPNNTQCSIK